jgi:hypothetical protein
MKRKPFVKLVTGVMLIMFATTGFAASDKISRKAKEHAQSGGSHEISVIVRYSSMPGQSEDQRLGGLQAQTERAYGQIKMRTVKVKANKLDDLVNDPNVEFVDLNSPVQSFTEAARLTTNMTYTRNGSQSYDGQGVGVAVIDSGVSNHNDVYENDVEQYSFLTSSTAF